MSVLLVATNVFIVVYLTIAWGWRLPYQSLARRAIEPFTPILLWFGCWHAWGVFAPYPPTTTRWSQIKLILESGEVVVWEPPYGFDLSLWQAFYWERFRKVGENVFGGTDYAFFQPQMCQYVLNRLKDDPQLGTSKVTKVEIVVFEEPIVAPWDTKPASPTISNVVFTYQPQGVA